MLLNFFWIVPAIITLAPAFKKASAIASPPEPPEIRAIFSFNSIPLKASLQSVYSLVLEITF